MSCHAHVLYGSPVSDFTASSWEAEIRDYSRLSRPPIHVPSVPESIASTQKRTENKETYKEVETDGWREVARTVDNSRFLDKQHKPDRCK